MKSRQEFNLIMGILLTFSLMYLCSCATLQKEKGYEQYSKNTNWNK